MGTVHGAIIIRKVNWLLACAHACIHTSWFRGHVHVPRPTHTIAVNDIK